jgi:hypothetical protein
MPSVSQSRHNSFKAARATGLEQVLKDRNTAIIGNTLHFESKSSRLVRQKCLNSRSPDNPALGVHDLDATIVNPSSIVEAIKSTDGFYHVWAAVKQTIDERCVRSFDRIQHLTKERQCHSWYSR